MFPPVTPATSYRLGNKGNDPSEAQKSWQSTLDGADAQIPFTRLYNQAVEAFQANLDPGAFLRSFGSNAVFGFLFNIGDELRSGFETLKSNPARLLRPVDELLTMIETFDGGRFETGIAKFRQVISSPNPMETYFNLLQNEPEALAVENALKHFSTNMTDEQRGSEAGQFLGRLVNDFLVGRAANSVAKARFPRQYSEVQRALPEGRRDLSATPPGMTTIDVTPTTGSRPPNPGAGGALSVGSQSRSGSITAGPSGSGNLGAAAGANTVIGAMTGGQANNAISVGDLHDEALRIGDVTQLTTNIKVARLAVDTSMSSAIYFNRTSSASSDIEFSEVVSVISLKTGEVVVSAYDEFGTQTQEFRLPTAIGTDGKAYIRDERGAWRDFSTRQPVTAAKANDLGLQSLPGVSASSGSNGVLGDVVQSLLSGIGAPSLVHLASDAINQSFVVQNAPTASRATAATRSGPPTDIELIVTADAPATAKTSGWAISIDETSDLVPSIANRVRELMAIPQLADVPLGDLVSFAAEEAGAGALAEPFVATFLGEQAVAETSILGDLETLKAIEEANWAEAAAQIYNTPNIVLAMDGSASAEDLQALAAGIESLNVMASRTNIVGTPLQDRGTVDIDRRFASEVGVHGWGKANRRPSNFGFAGGVMETPISDRSPATEDKRRAENRIRGAAPNGVAYTVEGFPDFMPFAVAVTPMFWVSPKMKDSHHFAMGAALLEIPTSDPSLGAAPQVTLNAAQQAIVDEARSSSGAPSGGGKTDLLEGLWAAKGTAPEGFVYHHHHEVMVRVNEAGEKEYGIRLLLVPEGIHERHRHGGAWMKIKAWAGVKRSDATPGISTTGTLVASRNGAGLSTGGGPEPTFFDSSAPTPIKDAFDAAYTATLVNGGSFEDAVSAGLDAARVSTPALELYFDGYIGSSGEVLTIEQEAIAFTLFREKVQEGGKLEAVAIQEAISEARAETVAASETFNADGLLSDLRELTTQENVKDDPVAQLLVQSSIMLLEVVKSSTDGIKGNMLPTLFREGSVTLDKLGEAIGNGDLDAWSALVGQIGQTIADFNDEKKADVLQAASAFETTSSALKLMDDGTAGEATFAALVLEGVSGILKTAGSETKDVPLRDQYFQTVFQRDENGDLTDIPVTNVQGLTELQRVGAYAKSAGSTFVNIGDTYGSVDVKRLGYVVGGAASILDIVGAPTVLRVAQDDNKRDIRDANGDVVLESVGPTQGERVGGVVSTIGETLANIGGTYENGEALEITGFVVDASGKIVSALSAPKDSDLYKVGQTVEISGGLLTKIGDKTDLTGLQVAGEAVDGIGKIISIFGDGKGNAGTDLGDAINAGFDSFADISKLLAPDSEALVIGSMIGKGVGDVISAANGGSLGAEKLLFTGVDKNGDPKWWKTGVDGDQGLAVISAGANAIGGILNYIGTQSGDEKLAFAGTAIKNGISAVQKISQGANVIGGASFGRDMVLDGEADLVQLGGAAFRTFVGGDMGRILGASADIASNVMRINAGTVSPEAAYVEIGVAFLDLIGAELSPEMKFAVSFATTALAGGPVGWAAFGIGVISNLLSMGSFSRDITLLEGIDADGDLQLDDTIGRTDTFYRNFFGSTKKTGETIFYDVDGTNPAFLDRVRYSVRNELNWEEDTVRNLFDDGDLLFDGERITGGFVQPEGGYDYSPLEREGRYTFVANDGREFNVSVTRPLRRSQSGSRRRYATVTQATGNILVDVSGVYDPINPAVYKDVGVTTVKMTAAQYATFAAETGAPTAIDPKKQYIPVIEFSDRNENERGNYYLDGEQVGVRGQYQGNNGFLTTEDFEFDTPGSGLALARRIENDGDDGVPSDFADHVITGVITADASAVQEGTVLHGILSEMQVNFQSDGAFEDTPYIYVYGDVNQDGAPDLIATRRPGHDGNGTPEVTIELKTPDMTTFAYITADSLEEAEKIGAIQGILMQWGAENGHYSPGSNLGEIYTKAKELGVLPDLERLQEIKGELMSIVADPFSSSPEAVDALGAEIETLTANVGGLFDSDAYLAANQDLVGTWAGHDAGTVAMHYAFHGHHEGRALGQALFDPTPGSDEVSVFEAESYGGSDELPEDLNTPAREPATEPARETGAPGPSLGAESAEQSLSDRDRLRASWDAPDASVASVADKDTANPLATLARTGAVTGAAGSALGVAAQALDSIKSTGPSTRMPTLVERFEGNLNALLDDFRDAQEFDDDDEADDILAHAARTMDGYAEFHSEKEEVLALVETFRSRFGLTGPAQAAGSETPASTRSAPESAAPTAPVNAPQPQPQSQKKNPDLFTVYSVDGGEWRDLAKDDTNAAGIADERGQSVRYETVTKTEWDALNAPAPAAPAPTAAAPVAPDVEETTAPVDAPQPQPKSQKKNPDLFTVYSIDGGDWLDLAKDDANAVGIADERGQSVRYKTVTKDVWDALNAPEPAPVVERTPPPLPAGLLPIIESQMEQTLDRFLDDARDSSGDDRMDTILEASDRIADYKAKLSGYDAIMDKLDTYIQAFDALSQTTTQSTVKDDQEDQNRYASMYW